MSENNFRRSGEKTPEKPNAKVNLKIKLFLNP
jgi:hypothetical protein